MEDEIREIMAVYRSVLENAARKFLADPRAIPRLTDEPLTTGFCRGSACATFYLLEHAFPEVGWRISGGILTNSWSDEKAGTPLPGDDTLFPGGMQTLDGRWAGHFWVKGALPDGRTVIVDGTADQFGWEEVLVTDGDDPRYRANAPAAFGNAQFLTDREQSFGFNLFLDWKQAAYQGPQRLWLATMSA